MERYGPHVAVSPAMLWSSNALYVTENHHKPMSSQSGTYKKRFIAYSDPPSRVGVDSLSNPALVVHPAAHQALTSWLSS